MTVAASQFNLRWHGRDLQRQLDPASDPLVTGVGGTTLAADINGGSTQGETAWTEVRPLHLLQPARSTESDINCSGGGFSTIYGRPLYQKGVPNTKAASRGEPDVSYNAGVNGGVLDPLRRLQHPQWPHPRQCHPSSSSAARARVRRSGPPSRRWATNWRIAAWGFINAGLYRISQFPALYKAAFHDVTTGNNTVADLSGQGYTGLEELGRRGDGPRHAERGRLLELAARHLHVYLTDGLNGARG